MIRQAKVGDRVEGDHAMGRVKSTEERDGRMVLHVANETDGKSIEVHAGNTRTFTNHSVADRSAGGYGTVHPASVNPSRGGDDPVVGYRAQQDAAERQRLSDDVGRREAGWPNAGYRSSHGGR